MKVLTGKAYSKESTAALGTPGPKKRNYGLDLARCAAVSFVFFSHSLLNLYNPDIPFLWYGVFLGVELFFSLSGFLIGRMLIDLFERYEGKLSFGLITNFWTRRWFRTLPLYFALYFIYLFVYNQWISPVAFDWRYLLFVQNFNTPPPVFYGESWSLGIEEWFYFGFPLLLFIVYLFRSSGKLFIPAVLFIITAQVIIRSFYPGCNAWGCTAVSLHFDATAYGLIAAYFSKQNKAINGTAAFWTGIFLCAAAAIIKMKVADTNLAQLYFLVNGAGTALVVTGLYYYNFSVKFKAVSFISRISYSIYLVHLSGIIIPLQKLTKNTWLQGTLILWLICLVLTLALSSLTYRLIEQPFLTLRDRWFPAR